MIYVASKMKHAVKWRELQSKECSPWLCSCGKDNPNAYRNCIWDELGDTFCDHPVPARLARKELFELLKPIQDTGTNNG